jgi:parallel beta-helix repeat protein
LFSAPIGTWSALKTAVGAAAGKTVTLTLSTPFDMTGFQRGSTIGIGTAKTVITIVGNGAVFDAVDKDQFFWVEQGAALVMSNVTLQNGNSPGLGGAIYVCNATATLSNCIFSGNTATGGYGGGMYVNVGGTVTLSDCTFSGNTAPDAGGALYVVSNANGLLKNCSLRGTVSPDNNDIARGTTANVSFACADGEVGTPVQMSGTEITKLPAPTCTAGKYICHNPPGQCVTTLTGGVSYKDCIEVCT